MVETNITLETFENIVISLLKEKGYDTEIVTWSGTRGPEHRLVRKKVEKAGSKLRIPLRITDVRNLFFGFSSGTIIDINIQKLSDVISEPVMYALTTNMATSGASIFYNGVLDELSDIFGGFFFIIPSSLCEVIVIPGDKAMSPEELSEMIKSVNGSNDIVKPEEILANHGYVYNHGKISAYV